MYEEYKKTIYRLAKLYDPIFCFNDNEWDDFASFISVDADCLKNCVDCEERTAEIGSMSFYSSPFFVLLIKTFICINNIKKIDELEYLTDDDSIRKVYKLLSDTVTLIGGLNADLAAFMCMKDERFSTNYAVQEWKNTNYQDSIGFLTYYLKDEIIDLDKDVLQLNIWSIKYDLETRLNIIYLSGVLLLIDDSPFINDDIKGISKDLYLYLITRLKNCRLIGMKLNIISPQVDIDNRGRIDNTTQMLMVYGYDNYDTYCLRLDLPHRGIRFLHYNNRSPGNGNNEVKCCILNREEYDAIIARYPEFPQLSEMFIDYGGQFALKERCNCKFDSPEEECLFNTLESEHEHIGFSEKEYDERSILDFIELLSYFFRLQRETIQSDEYAIKCFNFDRIMLQSKILASSIVHCELTGVDLKIDKQINSIVNAAFRYGIIERYDKSNGSYGIDDVKLVLEYTEDRISPLLR